MAFALLGMAFVLATRAQAYAASQRPLSGVALVIGQSRYEALPMLANPVEDARRVEQLLDGLGFDTMLALDRDARRLMRYLDGFVEDAQGVDVAVISWPGHGIEAGGENFLLPVDADLMAVDQAAERLVALSEIVRRLHRAASAINSRPQ